MIVVVDHPRPCMPPPPDATKMLVDLSTFDMPGRIEQLTIARSPMGGYVVACLPFFTYGIQFGDWVAVREPEMVFERVVKASGLRTLRTVFKDPLLGDRCHEELHRKLDAARLPHEWYRPGYLSVLIRNRVDQESVLTLAGDLIEDGSVEWEVDPEPFPS
jgi:hypothetical protein